MAETGKPIDNLEITINATAEQASQALEAVISQLGELEKVSQAVDKIKTAKISQLGKGIKNLADGLAKIKDPGSLSTLARGIEDINNADVSNIEVISGELKTLADSIKVLSDSGVNKIKFNFGNGKGATAGFDSITGISESEKAAETETKKFSSSLSTVLSTIDTAPLTDLHSSLMVLDNALPSVAEQFPHLNSAFEEGAEAAQEYSDVIDLMPEEFAEVSSSIEKTADDLNDNKIGLHFDEGTEQSLWNINVMLDQFSGVLSGAKQPMQALTSVLGNFGIELSSATMSVIGIASSVGTILVAAFKAAKKAVENYINDIRNLINNVKTGISKLEEFAKTIEKIAEYVKEWGKSLGETLSDLSGIPDMADKVSSAFSKLGKEVQKVTHLFTYMGLRKAFTAVYNEMGTAIDHLTQKFETFGTELTALQNELSYLGHSAAAVSVPLLDSLGGALTTIIDLLATAISYINMFISALTGKSTYVAAKKQIGSVDDALSGAAGSAEKVKDYLGDIDELNVINDNPSSGGGGGGVGDLLEDCYEELAIDESILKLVEDIKKAWEDADFSGIGEALGKAIKKALDNIPWDEIQEVAWKIAHSLATFINGFIETDGLAESVGKTIGEALNTALIFAHELLSTIEFDKIGRFIGTSLNEAIKWFDWDMLGETIGLYFSAQLEVLWNAVDEFEWDNLATDLAIGVNQCVQQLRDEINSIPWYDLGAQLGEGLQLLIDSIDWDNVGRLIGDYFKAKILSFDGFISQIQWGDIGNRLGQGIRGMIEEVPWENLGHSLGTAFGGIIHTLYNTLDTIPWDELAEGLATGVNSFVTAVNNEIDGLDWNETGEKFGNGIKTFMSLVNWGDLGDMLGNLVNIFLGFITGTINSQDEEAYAADLDELVTHFTEKVSWDDLGNLLEGLITNFLGFIATAIEGFGWSDLGTQIGEMLGGLDWPNIVSQLVEGIISGFKAKADFLGNGVLGVATSVIGDLANPFNLLTKSIGGDMTGGILEGVNEHSGDIGNAAKSLGSTFVDCFKYLLGISSPSTVMAEQGQYVVEGLQEGIENNWDSVPTFLEGAAGELEGILTGTWESIEGSTGDSWSSISSTITGEWESINSQADSSWSSISKTVTDTWSTLDSQSGKDFSSIKTTVNDTWTDVDSETSSSWSTIKSTFTDALDIVKSKVSDGWDNIKSKFSDSFNSVKSDTNSSLSTIQNDFSTSMTSVNNTVDTSWSSIKSGFNTSLATVSSDTSSSLNTIESDFTTFWTDTRTLTTDSWTDIESQTTTAWEMLIAELNTNMEEIREYITANWTELIAELTESWSQINEVTQSASEQMNSTITAGWEQIKNTTTEGVTAVKTAIESENWSGIGQQIVNGIYEGIADGWPKLEKYVRRLAKELYEAACDELEIDSPSKLFAKAGAFVVEGLNEGIEDNEDSTVTAVSDWLGNLGHMSANLDVDFNVSDNLKNYSPNLDTGIDTGSITRAVQESINAQGSVNAMLTGGADFKSVIRDAIDEVFTENKVLDEIAENTREQADKQETTRVYIGNREVARSVRKQNAADGYTFSSSVV